MRKRCQLIAQYPDYHPPRLIEAAICTGLELLENGQTLFSETAPSSGYDGLNVKRSSMEILSVLVMLIKMGLESSPIMGNAMVES